MINSRIGLNALARYLAVSGNSNLSLSLSLLYCVIHDTVKFDLISQSESIDSDARHCHANNLLFDASPFPPLLHDMQPLFATSVVGGRMIDSCVRKTSELGDIRSHNHVTPPRSWMNKERHTDGEREKWALTSLSMYSYI